MIDIKIVTEETPEILAFAEQEWKIADLHYYGREIDWKKERRFIQAYSDGELAGTLELDFQAGVMHIADVIIKHTSQRQGIGELLMDEAEKIAKQEHLHKIYLETGASWEARSFYEKLGYKKTGDLPNHYEHQDFVEYSKFL